MKQEKINNKSSRININNIEISKAIKKINEANSQFLQKINHNNKTPIKKLREKRRHRFLISRMKGL